MLKPIRRYQVSDYICDKLEAKISLLSGQVVSVDHDTTRKQLDLDEDWCGYEGGHTDFVDIVEDIENEFGLEFSDSEIEAWATVGHIVDAIRERMPA